MSSPYLVACLARLRDQFNHEFPDRAKGADGWIGDAAHASRTSDHNPRPNGAVLALDITTALNRLGIDMDDAFGLIVKRHQAKDDNRLEYGIWDRKIYSYSRGYKPIDYDGSDPHTGHAHLSARHDGTGWSSTAAWGLEELMTKDELRAVMDDALADFFARTSQGKANGDTVTSRIGRDALDQGVPNPIRGGKTSAWQLLVDTAAAVKPPAT